MSSASFTLNALDLESGFLRWFVTFPAEQEVRDIAASSGVVVVRVDAGGLHRLIGFDASDGTVRWEVDLPDLAVSRLRCTSETVAVAAMPLNLVAYHLSDGSPRWDFSELVHESVASVAWCEDGYPVHDDAVELAQLGLTLVVGTRQHLMALSAGTGELRWSRSLGTVEPIQVQADVAYVVDMQGNLHRVSIETGETLWSFDCEVEEDVGPVIAGDVVFVKPDAGDLHALESDDGSVRWRRSLDVISSFGKVAAGRTFVSSYAYDLSCVYLSGLDVATGETLWRREFEKTLPLPRVERASSDWCLVSGGGELTLLDAATGAELRTWATASEAWGLIGSPVGEVGEIVIEPGQVSRLKIEDLSVSWSTSMPDTGYPAIGIPSIAFSDDTLFIVGPTR